jgi:hypothetical protein
VFNNCACCGCASGSSASNQALDALRAARLCELSYTDNGLLSLLRANNFPEYSSEDLPPTTMQLALDLSFTAGVRFSVGSQVVGRYYIASVTLNVSSDLDPRFSTAMFANNCRLAASSTVRFVQTTPSDANIGVSAFVDTQFSSLNIPDDFSIVEGSAPVSNVRGSAVGNITASGVARWVAAMSPMGIRLEL